MTKEEFNAAAERIMSAKPTARITSYARDGVTYLRVEITHGKGRTVIEQEYWPETTIEDLAEKLRSLAQYLDVKRETYI